jgi:hypothetical protein
MQGRRLDAGKAVRCRAGGALFGYMGEFAYARLG